MANTHTHTLATEMAHGTRLVPFPVAGKVLLTKTPCKVAKRQAVWCCCKEPQEHNPSFLHEVGSEHSKEGGGLAVLPLPAVVAPPRTFYS